MLFYANVCGLGSLYTYHASSARKDVQRVRLECYSKTLELVAKEVDDIAKHSKSPSEELIVTVLILSAYNVGSIPVSRGFSATPDPDTTAVDPYYYRLTKSNYCHDRALKKLTSSMGGVNGIRTPGIADLVCLCVSSFLSCEHLLTRLDTT